MSSKTTNTGRETTSITAEDTSVVTSISDNVSDEKNTPVDNTSLDDKKKRKHRIILSVTAGVVTLALLVAGVYGIATKQSRAITDCHNANTAYKTAYKDYEKTLGEAETLSRTVISADQVADKTTYETFSKLVNEKISQAAPLNCDISFTGAFSATTASLDSKNTALKTKAEQLKTAIKNVQESKSKKDLADARSTAQAQLDQAHTTYNDSDGKVADNATRDTLKVLMDTLQKTLDKKNATLDEINKAVEPIQGAIDQVSQSVQAKADADKKAQEEAQRQAQAQQRGQSSTPQRGYGSAPQRSTPRSNNYGNRGGGSTPAPQGGNNSGDSSFDWQSWMNNRPQSPCEATGTCHYAVG